MSLVSGTARRFVDDAMPDNQSVESLEREKATLIRRYLEAGAMVEGVKVQGEQGTPQGGPVTPPTQ